MDFKEQAREKLAKELPGKDYDRYASAMKDAVHKALLEFIEQDEEFAQAIVQGGNFKDCMKAVANKCGSCISDLEAYERAVKFYFPGAKIRFSMNIDLIGDMTSEEPDDPNVYENHGLILDISSFL